MPDEHVTRLPWWAKTADAITLGLAVLAGVVLVTGGGRFVVAGIVVKATSLTRLVALAAIVAVARHVGCRREPLWARMAGFSPGRGRAGAADAGFADRAAHARSTFWILGACLLFYVVNNAIWLLSDASSPSYDKAAHAGFALHFLRLFRNPAGLTLAKLLAVTQYWPPFFHVASVPFTMALGFSVASVAATNFLFLGILVFSLFRVARRLFDDRVAAGAVALTLLYPMVYALSREVLVDFALIAMVVLSLDLVLSSDAGLDRRLSLLLGAVLGCTMLTKWSAVTFLAGPAILWFVVCLVRERPRVTSVAASLAMAAFAFLVVAGPWYVASLQPFLRGANVAFGSDPAQEGDPTRVLESLRWYWWATRSALILPPLMIATGVGLLAFAARVRSWTGWAFLLCWVVPAFAFFILIPNKDGRFVAPLLPAIAIAASAGIQALPKRSLRAAVWVFVVAAGVWQFYGISFGWPATIPHFYTHPPDRRDWKVGAIVTALSTLEPAWPLRVAVLPDHPDFEPNIFQLDASVRSLGIRIDGFGDRPEPVQALRSYDALVSKTGVIAAAHTARHRVQFREALDEWMAKGRRAPELVLWRTWDLPDGSRAEVYLIH